MAQARADGSLGRCFAQLARSAARPIGFLVDSWWLSALRSEITLVDAMQVTTHSCLNRLNSVSRALNPGAACPFAASNVIALTVRATPVT